jgi:hypothetical protein
MADAAVPQTQLLGSENALSVADGTLYVVGGSIRVDGRISWYSSEHLERYVPFNSYLLKEGDKLLLLETGVPATFETNARQLRDLLGEDAVIPRLDAERARLRGEHPAHSTSVRVENGPFAGAHEHVAVLSCR